MTTQLLSILMPAKNAAEYIGQAIESVCSGSTRRWELVVVNDGSSDRTESIVHEYSKSFPQVRLLQNKGSGKVCALNTAFAESKGDLIGTLDADDCLMPRYWQQIDRLPNDADCFTKDAVLINASNDYLGVVRMNRGVLDQPFDAAIRELTGLPRWTWTFRRSVGEKLFPIPDELPFEDIWFSLSIKRFAERHVHFQAPSYLYRQHGNQTFGGVLNYSSDVVRFRSWRLTQYAKHLPQLKDRLSLAAVPDLSEVSAYHELMSRRDFSLPQAVSAKMRGSWKAKAVLFRRFPFVSTLAKRLQWVWDKRR